MKGNAADKRQNWYRGNSSFCLRGNIKFSNKQNKHMLNRKVRHDRKYHINNGSCYKRICKTATFANYL